MLVGGRIIECGMDVNRMIIHFFKASVLPSSRYSIHPFLRIILGENIWGHPDIPIPYVLLPVILLPDIPIPDMPKRKIGISIIFDVFLPNIPIPDIYTGF